MGEWNRFIRRKEKELVQSVEGWSPGSVNGKEEGIYEKEVSRHPVRKRKISSKMIFRREVSPEKIDVIDFMVWE